MLANDETLSKGIDVIAQSNQFLCIVLTYRFFITEAECLQRGTDWTFKSDRYSFVLKELKGAGLMKTCLKYNL
jgi:hypothetical protein